MSDPKMTALVDYLRRGYRTPGETYQTPPEQVPRMSSEDYRAGQFLRAAPAKLPTREMLLTALLRRASGSGAPARASLIPPEP